MTDGWRGGYSELLIQNRRFWRQSGLANDARQSRESRCSALRNGSSSPSARHNEHQTLQRLIT